MNVRKLKNMNMNIRKIKNENKIKNMNMSIKKEILMLILIIMIKN